jgi:hypothetical protein
MGFAYDFYAAAARRRREIRRFVTEASNVGPINKIYPGTAKVVDGKGQFSGTWSSANNLASQLRITLREL